MNRISIQIQYSVGTVWILLLGSPTNITPFAHYWGPHYTYMVYLLTLRVMSVALQMFRYSEPLYTLGWITSAAALRTPSVPLALGPIRWPNSSTGKVGALSLNLYSSVGYLGIPTSK
eukprot:COSAG02_NODE_4952_length_4788_cov_252.664747_1_plen_117_part_00